MPTPRKTPDRIGRGLYTDTIAAPATPPGRGGIGVIRVSGPAARPVLHAVTGLTNPRPRHAHLVSFADDSGQLVDQGIALFVPAPHSFTGEDVIELHGHGGPVVIDLLLAAVIAAGARMALPGEFSERAFLNDKMDLTQAEAVADLIDSASAAAARNAARSLQGAFSARIDELAGLILELRIYVEAAIDFPEEEVDFLSEGHVQARTRTLLEAVEATIADARQGVLLTEGLHLALAGPPNVGKSSLLNRLAGYDRAIVTPVPGTTRDTLQEQITLDGIPIKLVDTAGLRVSDDVIEQEGIRRALAAFSAADRLLLLTEATDPDAWRKMIDGQQLPAGRVTVVQNKIDLSGDEPGCTTVDGFDVVRLSALTGAGIEDLIAHLKELAGYRNAEGLFSARRRHLVALEAARGSLHRGLAQLDESGAGELLAEDLRAAHDALGEIVGRVSADGLLGEIFSSFCIGK